MRKAAWAIAVALVVAVPAAAQFFVRPTVAPQTIIGNPNSVYAPAQAIPFATLQSDYNASNLLTPALPSTVDLNNLPPQTVVGNSTTNYGEMGFITFSQLKAFSTQSLPQTVYNSYDVHEFPGLAMAGNISSVATQLALPISLGAFFAIFSNACGNQLVLILSNSCALISVTNFGF